MIARLLVPDRPTRGDSSFSVKGRAWEQLLSREKTGADGPMLREGRAMEAVRGAGS